LRVARSPRRHDTSLVLIPFDGSKLRVRAEAERVRLKTRSSRYPRAGRVRERRGGRRAPVPIRDTPVVTGVAQRATASSRKQHLRSASTLNRGGWFGTRATSECRAVGCGSWLRPPNGKCTGPGRSVPASSESPQYWRTGEHDDRKLVRALSARPVTTTWSRGRGQSVRRWHWTNPSPATSCVPVRRTTDSSAGSRDHCATTFTESVTSSTGARPFSPSLATFERIEALIGALVARERVPAAKW